MKALFVVGGGASGVLAQAPLARAVRDTGHQVLVAGPDNVTSVTAQVGLPPVSVSPRTKQRFSGEVPESQTDQMRYVGRAYAELTADIIGPLRRVAEEWRPDIVVGGALFYPAGLLGHHLGLPTVRQPWGMLDSREYDAAAEEELRPLLQEAGLDSLPIPDLSFDACPPSLRRPGMPTGEPIRWIAGNLYRTLEPWMYARGSRPRVLLTSGSRVTREGALHTWGVARMRELAGHIAVLGAEVVIAAPDDVAAELRGESGEEPRAGWMPMDVVAPTCDLIVHHGGAGTVLLAVTAGVPQLIVREIPTAGEMQTQVEFGSAIDLPKEQHDMDGIVSACRRMLSDPSYAQRARLLAEETAEFPAPTQVVGLLEKLAGG